MTESTSHLRLLEIFHYVVGGIAALFAMFPMIHLVIGLMMVFSPESLKGKGDEVPPQAIGWFFVVFAAVFIALGLAFACCVIAAGRSIRKRRRYLFCLVMAGVECMFMPFGTVLGVFTIIVLVKEDVKRLFEPGATRSMPDGYLE
jgi:ABC-type Fe3+ transport system permease subunit